MIYIIHPDGTAFGPFDWKLVRFLYGLGLLIGYYVNEVGSQAVSLPSENTKMLKQPAWADSYITLPADSGFTKSQLEIFQLAGMPPLTALGHRYTGKKIISLIDEERIRAINPQILWRAEKEAALGWKTDPATDAQKSVISQNGIRFNPEITKGEASCLIGGPATEAQYRRLKFYGLGHIQNITKEEASELIDHYNSSFPDSEIEYQKSKAQPLIDCCDAAKELKINHIGIIDEHSPIFIYKNNEQNGPFMQAEILEMIGRGALLPNDLVWKDGQSIWLPASKMFHFNSPTTETPRANVKAKLEKQINIKDPNITKELLGNIEFNLLNTADQNLAKELLGTIEFNLKKIGEFIPKSKVSMPSNINELDALNADLKHAVDNYLSFTIEELEYEIFYDMGDGREYMFFFATPPTEEQLNNFKFLMLEKYFKKNLSENFNHLDIVKKAFPGVKPERMDI